MKNSIETGIKNAKMICNQVDSLVCKHTAFESMDAMINANGGYRPSICTESAKNRKQRAELCLLADIYDMMQKQRGDDRRAFRS